MCVCARAWATWLLSGPAEAASAPEIDPNDPDHFDMELEACLDAMAAHQGAMPAALHQQKVSIILVVASAKLLLQASRKTPQFQPPMLPRPL
jgi:hypothetical protein